MSPREQTGIKKQEGSYIGFGENSRPVFASLFIAARKGELVLAPLLQASIVKLLSFGNFFHLLKKTGEGDYGSCVVVQ